MHARPPDRAAVAQTDLCPRFPRPGPGAHLAGLRSLTAPRLSCRSARPLTLIPAHGYVPLIRYLEGSDAGGGAAFVEARTTAEAARRGRRGSAARTTSKREQRRRRRRRGRAHPARTAPRPLSTRRPQIFLILTRPPTRRSLASSSCTSSAAVVIVQTSFFPQRCR